jgi:hypothetical protein
MCIRCTTKNYEVRETWFRVTPCFLRNFIFHTFCWISVQYVDLTSNNFSPKIIRHIFSFVHSPCHVHDGTWFFLWMISFCYILYLVVNYILIPRCLQKIANSFESHPPFPSELSEFDIFSTLFFCYNFKFFEICECIKFVFEELYPKFPDKIINEH